ncbi:hypothetical protein LXT21_39285 [Myxococcus sp. K38C18041901]|uniref:hypothetical protein n=1 Tax=Myxococcus guangdongensis TaxID=2906760 RepID=UPI0020A80895|nr:hypothetical protein [Myxococcus guangdongensis]MCP3064833.1 hypothetical protein [Myxococcus guangdongensis]
MAKWLVPLLALLGAAFMTMSGYLSFTAALAVPFVMLAGAVLLGLTLVLAVLPVRRKVNFLSLAWMLAGLALSYVGLTRGTSWRFDQMEARFAPLITALESYHSSKGAYPESVKELVPEWIAQVPTCEGPEPVGSVAADTAYHRREDGSFGITCYTIVFWKYTYDSRKQHWYGWD